MNTSLVSILLLATFLGVCMAHSRRITAEQVAHNVIEGQTCPDTRPNEMRNSVIQGLCIKYIGTSADKVRVCPLHSFVEEQGKPSLCKIGRCRTLKPNKWYDISHYKAAPETLRFEFNNYNAFVSVEDGESPVVAIGFEKHHCEYLMAIDRLLETKPNIDNKPLPTDAPVATPCQDQKEVLSVLAVMQSQLVELTRQRPVYVENAEFTEG